MKTTTLPNKQLYECHDALLYFAQTVPHRDERGIVTTPVAHLPPLLGLDIAEIRSAIDARVTLLEGQMKALWDRYAVRNAKGFKVPVLRPLPVPSGKTVPGKADCPHEPLQLTLGEKKGAEQWTCNCGAVFVPTSRTPQLTDADAFEREKNELLEGTSVLETVALSRDDIAKCPDLPPGVLGALRPFILTQVAAKVEARRQRRR